MNEVEIELPMNQDAPGSDGDYYYDPVDTERCYRLTKVRSHVEVGWTTVKAGGDGFWNGLRTTKEEAVEGLKRCPPGTIITITVGGGE